MGDFGEKIPILQSDKLGDRGEKLGTIFIKYFGKKADFFVRVPGRVNLIGEHIDYCGYPVCPMALEQDILLAVSIENQPLIRLHNVESATFPDKEIPIENFEIKVSQGAPDWHQYFLCGVRGILDSLPKGESGKVKGMNVICWGTIPQRAGLSSSSALVSAAAMATARTNGVEMSKEKMASLCADSERHIGTQGGGMDQAIAFLANEGCAKLIEFGPLRSRNVVLPEGAIFVIAHSMAEMNKAATSDFNCRVVECRLAAQLMAKKQGLDWTKVRNLSEVQKALGLELGDMLKLTEKLLKDTPYTKEEILEELETTADILDAVSLTVNTRDVQSFVIKQRALHVFQEASRVQQFHAICSATAQEDAKSALVTLGNLMTASHVSLRDLYACSHSALDSLVSLSSRLALGARLTGAGWGGCTVALLETDGHVDGYLATLRDCFYQERGVEEAFETKVFVTKPRGGACFYV